MAECRTQRSNPGSLDLSHHATLPRRRPSAHSGPVAISQLSVGLLCVVPGQHAVRRNGRLLLMSGEGETRGRWGAGKSPLGDPSEAQTVDLVPLFLTHRLYAQVAFLARKGRKQPAS